MPIPMLGQPAQNLPSVPPFSSSPGVVTAAGNAGTGDQYGNAGSYGVTSGGQERGVNIYQEGGAVEEDEGDTGESDFGGDEDLGPSSEHEGMADAMDAVRRAYQFGVEAFGLLPKQGGMQSYQEGGGVDDDVTPEPSQDPGVAERPSQPDDDITGSVPQSQERGVPWLNRVLAPVFTSGM